MLLQDYKLCLFNKLVTLVFICLLYFTFPICLCSVDEPGCGLEVGGAPPHGHFYKLWLLLVVEARTVESE